MKSTPTRNARYVKWKQTQLSWLLVSHSKSSMNDLTNAWILLWSKITMKKLENFETFILTINIRPENCHLRTLASNETRPPTVIKEKEKKTDKRVDMIDHSLRLVFLSLPMSMSLTTEGKLLWFLKIHSFSLLIPSLEEQRIGNLRAPFFFLPQTELLKVVIIKNREWQTNKDLGKLPTRQ